ncbi:MAG: methyltransferase [Gammaproteobacteria bacterium]|nr:methyltransferase [Gammaproteobacteria bacterium]MDE0366804.1 methyltransferase [Gammaproteobacteria bacterium]
MINPNCAAVAGVLALALSLPAQADLAEAVTEARAGEIRTEAERARDANRKPAETLAFFGMQPDMRVLELLPGGGWYTKILAPVLYDEGELFISIGTDRLKENLLGEPGFDRVKVVETDGEFKRVGRLFEGLTFQAEDMDLVLTFRNLHNFTPDGREAINASAFAALKPGGHYGVVDHTRRHMQEDNHENWRRMDPVLAIKEIEAAGFEFIDYSKLHYRLDDELRYEVGRRSVSGNTDRFTLLFRKP